MSNLATFFSIHGRYTIYAVQVIGDQAPILAENVDGITIMDNGDITYKTTNKQNVVQLEEKFIIIPFHAIAKIAFNTKPYADTETNQEGRI